MLQQTARDGIVTLRLAHGKASALDLDLVYALSDTLDRLAGARTRAIVLTGTGGIFSAGVDLFKLAGGGDEYVLRFLPALDRMFQTLFTFPAPVVAAINGHAIAGGCVLACSCDRRFMIDGAARIGLPELKVGVPFPPLVVEIMRSTVPPPHFNELLYVGRTYEPEAALARGIVDVLTVPNDLLARAQAAAVELAAAPAASFSLTKRAMRQPYVERAERMTASGRDALVAAWASEETRAALRAYVASTLGSKT